VAVELGDFSPGHSFPGFGSSDPGSTCLQPENTGPLRSCRSKCGTLLTPNLGDASEGRPRAWVRLPKSAQAPPKFGAPKWAGLGGAYTRRMTATDLALRPGQDTRLAELTADAMNHEKADLARGFAEGSFRLDSKLAELANATAYVHFQERERRLGGARAALRVDGSAAVHVEVAALLLVERRRQGRRPPVPTRDRATGARGDRPGLAPHDHPAPLRRSATSLSGATGAARVLRRRRRRGAFRGVLAIAIADAVLPLALRAGPRRVACNRSLVLLPRGGVDRRHEVPRAVAHRCAARSTANATLSFPSVSHPWRQARDPSSRWACSADLGTFFAWAQISRVRVSGPGSTCPRPKNSCSKRSSGASSVRFGPPNRVPWGLVPEGLGTGAERSPSVPNWGYPKRAAWAMRILDA
jgi:hypothetical protein